MQGAVSTLEGVDVSVEAKPSVKAVSNVNGRLKRVPLTPGGVRAAEAVNRNHLVGEGDNEHGEVLSGWDGVSDKGGVKKSAKPLL